MNHGLISLMFVAIMLSGCAKYQWVKAGSSMLTFEKDKHECESQAVKLYPPQLLATETVMVQPTRNCSSVSHGAAQICNEDPVVKWSHVHDENENKRNEYIKHCFIARGYKWDKVDK